MVTLTTQQKLRHTTARHGELRLGFARHNNFTVMKDSFFRPPLQVMRSITDAAGCACVYILSPTGGIVQGDRYDIQITVEENAHALVTTLAATKIYKMPDDYAAQTIHIEVKSGGVLEFVPDAAILFENADFHQSIYITLHDDAALMFQDSIMPGRLASGESLNFRRFKNLITVRDAQGLLLHEQQDITPRSQNLNRLGGLEDYRCWASWYLLGDLSRFGVEPTTFCETYAVADGILGSATRLHRDGVNIRLLANYWSPLAGELDRLRKSIRKDHMNLPATDLRK